MSLITLKNALMNKHLIIDASNPEIVSRANETAETLINRSNRDHRSDAQIRAHALEGTIREFAIVELTGGEINSQTPDFVNFDRNTFGWDVLAHDLFIEVKPQRGENFNIRERTKNTLMNNAGYYDVIVTVDIEQLDSTDYKVTPILIIRNEDFVKHVKSSQFKDPFGGDTYFYDSASPCIKLNKPIIIQEPEVIDADDFVVQLPELDEYGSETLTTIFSRHYPKLAKEWMASKKRLKIVEGDRSIAVIEPYQTLISYRNGRFKKTIHQFNGLWFPSYALAANNLLELYDSRFAECEAGFIKVKIPA